MLAFDPNDYRRRVLAPIHARGGAEQSDPFEIYDIPLEDAGDLDDAAVAARVGEVWAFWQRSRDHPRYRGVVLGLLARHRELTGTLATRTERLALAARVSEARAAREGERFAALDAAAARLVERFGGIPVDKLPGLRALAAAAGVDGDVFERRIARYRRLPAGSPQRTGRRPVSPEVLRQVRADLDELGRIIGEDAPRSLFGLLGVAPGADQETIRAVRAAATARNRARRPDRRRALVDDLLAAVGTLLVEGDPEAYLDALAAAATERLRPRMAASVLVEDRLLPEVAADLVAAAEAEGLDRVRAEAVVAALAREHGVEPVRPPRLATGQRPAGSRPAGSRPVGSPPAAAAAGRSATGTSSAATSGASARGRAGRDSDSDSHSHSDTGAASDEAWRAVLAEASAALHEGQPIAASDKVAHARELAGRRLPPIDAVGAEVEAAIRTAGERWTVLAAELAAGRYRRAQELAAELLRTARDVPGPRGVALAEIVATIEDRCRQAADLLAAARVAGPGDRAGLALAALELVADLPDARELIAANLAPPGVVRAVRAGGAIEVSWAASPTAGVRYRVTRLGTDGSSRAVGVTAVTRIDDGGVPRGAPEPGYEVRAGLGGVWSEPAVWTPGGAAPRIPASASPSPSTSSSAAAAAAPTAVATAVDGPARPAGQAAWSGSAPASGSAAATGTRPATVSPVAATAPAGGCAVGAGDVLEDPGVPATEAGAGTTRVLERNRADGLPSAADLVVVAGRLRWTWPEGCTEAMVVWRPDAPPIAADDPAAQSRKVTNARYEIDGGVALPVGRPLHVAVFGCLRDGSELVVARLAGPAARRLLGRRDRLAGA